MYPPERIEELKKQNERYYLREYELEIVPDEGAIIHNVHYYDQLPQIRAIALGTDLAISMKQTADYTAFNAVAEGIDGKYYSLKSMKKRLSFNDTLVELDRWYKKLKIEYPMVPVLVGWEDVAYQRAGSEEATRRYKLPIKSIKRTSDKRSRLNIIEPHISSGQVLYRKNEDAELVIELLGFGVEPNDDLLDAHEMAVHLLIDRKRPDIMWL
jgi:predicted phage terminase large subunit-like protein